MTSPLIRLLGGWMPHHRLHLLLALILHVRTFLLDRRAGFL